MYVSYPNWGVARLYESGDLQSVRNSLMIAMADVCVNKIRLVDVSRRTVSVTVFVDRFLVLYTQTVCTR